MIKKLNISKKKLFLSMFLIASVGGLLFFQNCSKQKFAADYSNTSASTDAVFYTNKRDISIRVKVNSPFAERFDRMRASIKEDMTDVSWQPRADEILVDLDTEFMPDGSKDGPKTIYIEVSESAGEKNILAMKQQVFLDTVPPTAQGLGILASGPDKDYNLNENASIEWSASDVLSSTGVSSGLGEKAISIGYTHTNNCAGGITWVAKDLPNTTQYSNFPWPGVSPLDTFYVCVLVQDLAGNAMSIISQPMTRLWKVIAGDNNKGDGGSALASNVRFNSPFNISIGKKGSIYIYDNGFNIIREIDSDGKIRLLAGNPAKPVPTVPSDGLQSAVQVSGSNSNPMAIDSRDRIYYGSPKGVWRITKGAEFSSSTTLELLSGPLGWTTTVAIDKNDVVYISNVEDWNTGAGTYIYKISLADLETKKPTLSQLKANYIFAGNGTIPSGYDWNQRNTASNDPISVPWSMIVGDAGELYYLTRTTNTPLGDQQIRVLKKDANGILRNYLIMGSVSAAYDLEFVKTTNERFLLFGNSSGVIKKINLDTCNLGVDICSYTQVAKQLGAASSIRAVFDSKGEVSYVSASPYESKVLRRNQVFTPILSYGRDVYSSSDDGKSAINAVINTPRGLAEDKRGNVIFFENRTAVLRQVGDDGILHFLAGTPYVSTKLQRDKVYDFSHVTFGIPVAQTLGYDEPNDVLYYGSYTQGIHKIDLVNKVVSLYGPAPTIDKDDPNAWTIRNLNVRSMGLGLDPELYVNRLIEQQQNMYRSAVVKNFGSHGEQTQFVVGTGNIGDYGMPDVGAIATQSSVGGVSLARDSMNNLFFSQTNLFGVADGKIIRVSAANVHYGDLAITEESGKKYFFSVSDISNKIHVTVDGVTKELCFPGSYLDRAGAPIVSRDGNYLIFADYDNNRIIKYLIKNQGHLDFVSKTDPRCPQ
jgi:hypothetical protein